MNQHEFMEAVLGPMKKIAAVREIDRARDSLLELTEAPVSEDTPVAIGCFGPGYQLVFSASENFSFAPSLVRQFEKHSEADLSEAAAEAAKDFCKEHHTRPPVGEAISRTDVSLITDTLFYLYTRSRGEYVPRPERNLRIANIRFRDIQSNSRTVFLAYWTKRRLQV